ncbi:MAG: hypothetical protein COA43_11495 [Robiginitomaculum sp.]|nr:MAG: hypothetical protein COA43_11495 [Robiginitomaculum sp.]
MGFENFDFSTYASIADQLLMDVAFKIQLTPSDYKEATQNYEAVSSYVDGSGSLLEGKVIIIYPSGSFGIGAPILGKIKAHKHDIDVVIELDLPENSDPEWVLTILERSLDRGPGSRYHKMVKRNSRCITITYADGHTLDVMPVVRRANILTERVSQLFHWKKETRESYHKDVNPKGFTKHFKSRVGTNDIFMERFGSHRLALLAKAETEDFPEFESLDRKSPRIVALQLIKRARDVSYRSNKSSRKRKPPSVIKAGLALEAGPILSPSLSQELLNVATHIRDTILQCERTGVLLDVRNVSYRPDCFTDRWPSNNSDQSTFRKDLDSLIMDINVLRSTTDVEKQNEILVRLFGETAATHAIKTYSKRLGEARAAGRTIVGVGGSVSVAPNVYPSVPKRTNFGSQ